MPRQHLPQNIHSACSNRGGSYDAPTLPTFEMRLDDLQSANLITSETALRWLDLQGCLTERSALGFLSLYIHAVSQFSGSLNSSKAFPRFIFVQDTFKHIWTVMLPPSVAQSVSLKLPCFSSNMLTYLAPCICGHICLHEGSCCPVMPRNSYIILQACMKLSCQSSDVFISQFFLMK